jgi:hypothetical protein
VQTVKYNTKLTILFHVSTCLLIGEEEFEYAIPEACGNGGWVLAVRDCPEINTDPRRAAAKGVFNSLVLHRNQIELCPCSRSGCAADANASPLAVSDGFQCSRLGTRRESSTTV